MEKNIAILAGDGIGPEVMAQSVRVLNAIAHRYSHVFHQYEAKIGGAAFDEYGVHFPDETKAICENANAILFGSVGGSLEESQLKKWQDCEINSILALRKLFKLQANIRLACIYPQLLDLSPLKNSRIAAGVDMIIVRELIGDSYFGEKKFFNHAGKRHALDVAQYDEQQIAAVAHIAFQLARRRTCRVTSVDKANVLRTSKLWREVMTEVSIAYPDVKLEHMLVDNCALQFFICPSQFDIIVTSNLFGDILSDAAAALPGSLGLMPSASINDNNFGLYEPSGGSAPAIAGQNKANPIAQILSVAMMLRHSFLLEEEALAIEMAVRKTLMAGFHTEDIRIEGGKLVGTKEITDVILTYI